MTPVAPATSEFAEFVAAAEPRLRLALGAAFGFDMGEDATAEALAFAWEHWERVAACANPIGYVFAAGRNWARDRIRRRAPRLPAVAPTEIPWVEPGLPGALERLSGRQREVVMLVHCFEWTLAEVAEVLGMSKGSVQVHERRGMARLRHDLGCSGG
ncbi:sigma factor-like helix-turn-helix DNA-binding protein [Nakamurella sp.]|uniref:sigma factor-like helix-turn-helix DNA-binding protein n=1 Tax=Nakamurella sp. TaxID=1869182 RepID=UPI00378418D0